jgi:hypothetical protein
MRVDLLSMAAAAKPKKALSNFENNIVTPSGNVIKLVDTIKQSRKVCSQELNFENY